MGYIYNARPYMPPPQVNLSPITNSYIVPAGTYIVSFVVNPVNADVLQAGYTLGASELAEDFAMDANDNNTVDVQRKFDVDTPIYFTGLTGAATLTIYKL